MNQNERKILHSCFAKTLDLFQQRKQAESWSENLLDGSRQLTTPVQWKHYYVWLAQPSKYCEADVDKMEIDTVPCEIEPYPQGLEVETLKNGNYETFVRVRNPKWYTTTEEKTPE